MTRINCVPPSELCNKHLLAEYRELPRVYRLAYNAKQRGWRGEGAPAKYTLGPGHVKFFYCRLAWLTGRYRAIVQELTQRGFNLLYQSPPSKYLDKTANWQWLNWEPDAAALQLNRARLKARLPKAYPNLTEEGALL
jgi:deoxyribonuclease (pyrimidine dimer)